MDALEMKWMTGSKADDFKPWNVKDFPTSLRTQITDAASRQGLTVAVWLTHHFETHGIDGVEIPAIPSKDPPANRDLDALDRAIDRACRLAQHVEQMPKQVASLAFGLVKDELRALKPPRSPRERLPQLTHEKPADG
jgi:hypothetical protein